MRTTKQQVLCLRHVKLQDDQLLLPFPYSHVDTGAIHALQGTSNQLPSVLELRIWILKTWAESKEE